MIIFSPDSQTLKNIVSHCSQTLEEIMQFLSPNQLWNSLDGCSVTDVVLQMLLFPHKRNPSSIPSSFLFQEETTEGDMARRKLVAQAPSFRACSHTRLHVPIFSCQMPTAARPAGPWLIWTTVPLQNKNLQLIGSSKQSLPKSAGLSFSCSRTPTTAWWLFVLQPSAKTVT